MTLAAVSLLVARRGALGFAPILFGTRHQSARGVTRLLSSTSSDVDEAQLMQDMLHRIRRINQVPDDVRASVLDFTVDGVMLGKVGHHFLRDEIVFCRIGTSHKFGSFILFDHSTVGCTQYSGEAVLDRGTDCWSHFRSTAEHAYIHKGSRYFARVQNPGGGASYGKIA
jgi:hypothetical protein